MSLRSLLEAYYSRRRCELVISQLGRTCRVDMRGRYIPIRWLFDGRASGDQRYEVAVVLLGGAPTCGGPMAITAA